MNSISWIIYLSDVVGNFQPLLAIGGVIACAIAGICILAWGLEDWEYGPKVARNILFWAIPAIMISCLIPSKTTMYAIAASQIGEAVATSNEGREMVNDTKQILRDYLKSLKKGTVRHG